MAKGSEPKSIVIGKVRETFKSLKEKRNLRRPVSEAIQEAPKEKTRTGKPITSGIISQSEKELGIERALRIHAAETPRRDKAAKPNRTIAPTLDAKAKKTTKTAGQERQVITQAPKSSAGKQGGPSVANAQQAHSKPIYATSDYIFQSGDVEVQKVASVASNVDRWVSGSNGGLFKIHPGGPFKFVPEDFAQKPAKKARSSAISFDVIGVDGRLERHELTVHVDPGRVAESLRGNLAKLKRVATQSEPASPQREAAHAKEPLPTELYDVLDLSGATPPGGSFDVVYSGKCDGVTGYEGTITYFDPDGTLVGTLDFTAVEEIMPCFTPGMMVKTARGDVPVEKLKQGDMVQTKKNGFQPVRWVGSKHLTRFQLRDKPALNPIRILGSALGSKEPTRRILVSPQQRVLVENSHIKAQLGLTQDLVPAQDLVGLRGVEVAETRGVTYIHVMLDAHQTILVDGVWFESFQPGDASLAALDTESREEIFKLFPDLRELDGVTTYQPKSPVSKSIDAKAALAD